RPGNFDLHSLRPEVDLGMHLPEQQRRAYDVGPLVRDLMDERNGESDFADLQPEWAPNIITGLGRFAGCTVDMLANNPLRLGGCLGSLSAEKAAGSCVCAMRSPFRCW